MTDPKRTKVTYVTADRQNAITLDIPFGVITPPTIECRIPLVGYLTFYFASCYRIKPARGTKTRGLHL
jgi:hypothetical protein